MPAVIAFMETLVAAGCIDVHKILSRPRPRPRPRSRKLTTTITTTTTQGIARQRQAIMAGLKESVQSFQSEVNEVGSRDVLSLMLLTQYFDAIKEIGVSGKTSTVFVPSNPGAVADLASQVRAGILQGDAANVNRR